MVLCACFGGGAVKDGPLLQPEKWQALPLVDKAQLTHNSARFRFALPSPDQELGLPLGQHISLKVNVRGQEVIRQYTPVSDVTQRGHVDFVIKVYPDGQMTQALDRLPLGGRVLFKGPRGRFTYARNKYARIGMLAGGTGVAPMFQLLQAILNDPNDTTQLSLLYGNLSEGDVLLRAELESLAAAHPSRLSLYLVLDHPPDGWTQGAGFISQDMIRERLPAPAPGTIVLRCGPPGMNKAMAAHLDVLGYGPGQQFQF